MTEATAMPGRKPATSRTELEHVAFRLFADKGFEQTTVDDIAAAAGIGRRTFFRYFPSKNDIPWGNFEQELERMRVRLKECPREVPLMDAVRVALVDFNTVSPDQVPQHRRRMQLILRVPALLAHSTLRFAAWREVVADFVAERSGANPEDLAPQTVSHAVLGVAIAAYQRWLDDESADLSVLLDAAMRELESAFTGDELSTARWPEVERAARRLLVVPVGSLEQHGPHLPLDTDTRIAVAVARRACAGRPGVALAPPVAIGASGEHAAFPGTLSIGTEALTGVLTELGRHASLDWPAMLLVNGHGGNADAIAAATDLLRAEGRTCVAWHAALPAADDDSHAGRAETSVMLALAPRDVALARAERGEVSPLAAIMPLLRERGVRAVSPNGVLGDPAGASAAEGEALIAALASGLSAVIDGLLAVAGA